ncbi:pilus assembly protein [Polymorphobacter sp. PAMC 29334]|uniref:TadE/TadG family type IV pilus assembly protein n=1 Tax=Polymorphobacter sp. PAMC 29334 TaxID=2862331 RepID=UPI001C74DA64|nr:TadE/TadG family type IV pilus assembly protein [Polymorphobacter sp. PAMC 29334]QYE36591.1 pilus assembly protein [Polymorphobacter sp. PAMC 29334]
MSSPAAAARRSRGVRSGSSAVEFALVLVPLMMLLFGGIEFGRLLWTRNAMQQTAVATARCLGVHQSQCATGGVPNVTKAVTFAQTNALGLSVAIPAAGVAVTASGTCGGQTGFALVTLTLTFRTAVPKLLTSLGANPVLVTNACFPNQT